MWLDLNGKRVQTGSTKTMIFSVAKLVSACCAVGSIRWCPATSSPPARRPAWA